MLHLYVSPTLWVNPAQFETSLLGGSDPNEQHHTTIVDEWAQEDSRSNLWNGFDKDDSAANDE